MKKVLLTVLLAALAVSAGRAPSRPAYNTRHFYDTLYVASTADTFSQVFWQDAGMEKTLLIEMNDTSVAGFDSDSCAFKLELYQAWQTQPESTIILLPSRANPDSTGWPYSSDFVLFDSLDIADMDTVSTYRRVAIPSTDLSGDTTGYYYKTGIDTLISVSAQIAAFAYVPIAPDASAGVAVKITGKASNKKGAGSRIILKWFQVKGQPVDVVGK